MTNQPQFDQPTRQPAEAPVADQGYQPPVANPVPHPDQGVAVPEPGVALVIVGAASVVTEPLPLPAPPAVQ